MDLLRRMTAKLLGLGALIAAGSSIALAGCTGPECFTGDPDCFLDEMVVVEPVDGSEPIALVKIDRAVFEGAIPEPTCDGTICGDTCVNTDVDDHNCGGCGIGCNGGGCFDGSCACVPPKMLCNGQCVDTGIDPDNCGTCGTACDAVMGNLCSGGSCTDACDPATTTKCDLSCVDTTASVDHCGGCDTACKLGEICDSGACACPDPPPYPCGCIDPATDAQNCGGCGIACGADATCEKGICVTPSVTPTGPLSILNQPVPMIFTDSSQLEPLQLRWHDDSGCKPAFCAQLCNESTCSQSFMCAPGSASPVADVWRPYLGFLAETRSGGIRFSLDIMPVSAAGCPGDVLDRLSQGDASQAIFGNGVRIETKVGEDDVSAIDDEKQCSATSTVCSCEVRACGDADSCWYEVDGGRILCGEDCNCVVAASAVSSACCGTP